MLKEIDFEIDEKEATLMRRVFQMYVDRMSMRAIVAQLTTEGLPIKKEHQEY
jgi:Recombinase